MKVLFFINRDQNYRYKIQGNPITVNIGNDIYVKVISTIEDNDVKMRLENCYTLPNPTASVDFRYFLLQNGYDITKHFLNTLHLQITTDSYWYWPYICHQNTFTVFSESI